MCIFLWMYCKEGFWQNESIQLEAFKICVRKFEIHVEYANSIKLRTLWNDVIHSIHLLLPNHNRLVNIWQFQICCLADIIRCFIYIYICIYIYNLFCLPELMYWTVFGKLSHIGYLGEFRNKATHNQPMQPADHQQIVHFWMFSSGASESLKISELQKNVKKMTNGINIVWNHLYSG